MSEVLDFLAYTALGMFTITFSVVVTTALIMLIISGIQKIFSFSTGEGSR